MLTQKQRASKLKRYRAEQAAIAWERDDGLCQRCGAYVEPGTPPHHVYRHGCWNTRLLYEAAD